MVTYGLFDLDPHVTQAHSFVHDIKEAVRATRASEDICCCVQPALLSVTNKTKLTN